MAVMPQGVEHQRTYVDRMEELHVAMAVMPQGVEHF